MNIVQIIFVWIVYSSLTTSFMILLLLLIKKALNNYMSSKLQHILWILVLIKLLIPFSIESNLSIYNLLPETNYNLIESKSIISKNTFLNLQDLSKEKKIKNNNKMKAKLLNTVKSNSHSDNETKLQSTKSKKLLNVEEKKSESFSLRFKIATHIWLTGFLCIFVFILVSIFGFNKRSKDFNIVMDSKIINILDKCKTKLNISKNVCIYYDNNTYTPFVYGYFNPKIYISKRILKTTDENQLLYIFLHELSHYKRKDLICNLFAAMAIMFHWFNPLVWFAMKKMKEDIEIACDNHVLELLDENEIIDYGMTVLNFFKIFSTNNKNIVLHSCFSQNKNQIKRRIVMIKMFKKGSYKISAMAIMAFILLGAVTLTNPKDSIFTTTTLASTYKDLTNNDKDEFILDSYYKGFNTLDRATDFLNFEFKVPDYLPKDYELEQIILNKKDVMNIKFWLGSMKSKKEHDMYFSFFISKENLIKHLNDTMHTYPDIKFEEKPITISNIQGTDLTIKYNWSSTKASEIEPYNSIEKYFIWKSEDMYYGIQYYDSKLFDSKISEEPSIYEQLDTKELEKIIKSLKYPKEIKNVKYESKHFEKLFWIYGNKDLIKSKKLLDFSPKFPLNVEKEFVPTSSIVYEEIYTNDKDEKEERSCSINTTFNFKKDLSKIKEDSYNDLPKINLIQKKNSSFYNELNQKGYFEKDYKDVRESDKHVVTSEVKKINVNSFNINNIKVFTYQAKDFDYILEKTTLNQYYVWKQDNICYELSINNNIDNKEEILKALINEKPYLN